jgi:hypothetical protein
MRWEKLDCRIEDRAGNVIDEPCCLLDAMPRARKLGPGHRVVRRDGVVLATTMKTTSEMRILRLINNAARAGG